MKKTKLAKLRKGKIWKKILTSCMVLIFVSFIGTTSFADTTTLAPDIAGSETDETMLNELIEGNTLASENRDTANETPIVEIATSTPLETPADITLEPNTPAEVPITAVEQTHQKDPEMKDDLLPVVSSSKEIMATSIPNTESMTLAPLINLAVSGNPGDVFLTKVANQVPIACRTYSVTLGASGNPVVGFGNVDVVIVIDKSLSMNDDLSAVQNIVKQLISSINSYVGNQVGLVSFNSTATTHELAGGSKFSSSKTDWNGILNTIESSGSSNIASGITAAKEILLTSSRFGNQNVIQSIIVLSDGIGTTTLGGNTTDAYIASAFDSIKTSSMTAVESANSSDIKVYGINWSLTTPISEKTFGEQMMKGIGVDGYTNISSNSGDPKTYSDTIYSNISTSIYSAARNGIVTDIIDPRFEFMGFTSHDGLAPTISNVAGKQVITWNVGAVTAEEKSLTYTLKAKLEYPAGTPVLGTVPTNESAYLSFTPASGSTVTSPKYFPVPTVYVAAPLTVSLTDITIVIGNSVTLGTGSMPGGQNYMSVSGGWYTEVIPQVLTYQWYLASDTAMTTPINPTVNPEVDTKYRVKVTDAYGCTSTAEMLVKPRGGITITKIVENSQSVDANREFIIWVLGPGGKAWAVTLKNGQSKTLTGLLNGNYTISESPPMNFKLISISEPSINISTSSPSSTSVVTNRRVNTSWFYDEFTAINSFITSKVFP